MPLPAQQIRFCTSRDGVRIAYATCGAGPPLVWVQHWAHHLDFDWDGLVWRPWLSMLARRHTLVRHDWRGCGLSDRERVEFSLEKYVEDLDAVVEAAGLDRFVLFAMAGSGSAITWTARHPGRVTHLVLLGSQVRGRLARSQTPEQVEEGNTRLKMYEIGWQSETPAYSQFFTSLHLPDATAEQTREHQHVLRTTTSPSNAIGMLRAFWNIDARDIAAQVRCPTLVLHARGDAVIPFNEGRSVAALIPGARFVALESRNHILLDTEPAWPSFIDALEDFLPTRPASLLDELTAREREVLEVVAQGLDNSGIAARLKISDKTARNHVSTIFSKLGVTSRAQAVALARDLGLGRKGTR